IAIQFNKFKIAGKLIQFGAQAFVPFKKSIFTYRSHPIPSIRLLIENTIFIGFDQLLKNYFEFRRKLKLISKNNLTIEGLPTEIQTKIIELCSPYYFILHDAEKIRDI